MPSVPRSSSRPTRARLSGGPTSASQRPSTSSDACDTGQAKASKVPVSRQVRRCMGHRRACECCGGGRFAATTSLPRLADLLAPAQRMTASNNRTMARGGDHCFGIEAILLRNPLIIRLPARPFMSRRSTNDQLQTSRACYFRGLLIQSPSPESIATLSAPPVRKLGDPPQDSYRSGTRREARTRPTS